MYDGGESCDVVGITSLLKGASDAQVCSIVVAVCHSRPKVHQKLYQQLSEPVPDRLTGVIKSFTHEKKYGFIDCAETFEAYGRDVFLSGAQLGGFQKGSRVSFVVTTGKDNQPQAQDLQDADGSGGGAGAAPWFQTQMMAKGGKMKGMDAFGKGMDYGKGVDYGKAKGMDFGKGKGMEKGGKSFASSYGGKPGPEAAMSKGISKGINLTRPTPYGDTPKGKGASKAPAVQYDDGSRAVGVIKSFKQEKMFGFIDCPEVYAQVGRDVFLSNAQIGAFAVGSRVSFSMTLNAQGHPQAQDLQDASGMADWAPAANSDSGHGQSEDAAWMSELETFLNTHVEDNTQSMEWQSAHAEIAALAAGAGASKQGKGAPPELSPERYTGLVKRFDAEKKYGFIDCPELKATYGNDPFLSAMQIGPFQNGSVVTFQYALKNGKAQAYELQEAEEGAEQQQTW